MNRDLIARLRQHDSRFDDGDPRGPRAPIPRSRLVPPTNTKVALSLHRTDDDSDLPAHFHVFFGRFTDASVASSKVLLTISQAIEINYCLLRILTMFGYQYQRNHVRSDRVFVTFGLESD